MELSATLKLAGGAEMPPIGLGTWQLTGKEALQRTHDALEAGYRMIDTSGDYNNQPQIGEALSKSRVERSNTYIVSKVEEIDDAYQKTRLNLDELVLTYIDLILIHRPPIDGSGVDLWRGLMRAKTEGLVRDIGVSNYSVEQISELYQQTGEIPAVNQIEWSPFGYSQAMYDYCRSRQIIIQAYSPLTRGSRLGDALLGDLASTYQRTPAQILLRWNLQRGTVPLPKSSSREHLQENLDIFDFELTEDDMRKLNAANEHYSALAPKLLYVE